MVDKKTFSASTDFTLVRGVTAVIICVPTPLNKNREPDISYITETGKAMAKPAMSMAATSRRFARLKTAPPASV